MKQGSTDDPFAEEPEESQEESTPDSELEPEPDMSESESTTTVQQQSLPYIHARDNVKEGRQQKPIFFQDPSVVGDLMDDVEDLLDEDVYKIDAMEAAFLVAKENPELVEAKLREWGYGMS